MRKIRNNEGLYQIDFGLAQDSLMLMASNEFMSPQINLSYVIHSLETLGKLS